MTVRKARRKGIFEKHQRHGMVGTATYNSYNAARNRCLHPKNNRYYCYGARGVEFRFTCFAEFFEEVGPKPSSAHTIDRINNNGHYEKGNVRWATREEQMANRPYIGNKIAEGVRESWKRSIAEGGRR